MTDIQQSIRTRLDLLVPNPTATHESRERFFNRDIIGLSPEVRAAEAAVLSAALAEAVFFKYRERLVHTFHGFQKTDVEWIRERVVRLSMPYRRAASA